MPGSLLRREATAGRRRGAMPDVRLRNCYRGSVLEETSNLRYAENWLPESLKCDSPTIGDRWAGRKTRLLEGLGWPARNASESHGGGEKRCGTCQFVSRYAVGKTGSGRTGGRLGGEWGGHYGGSHEGQGDRVRSASGRGPLLPVGWRRPFPCWIKFTLGALRHGKSDGEVMTRARRGVRPCSSESTT